jgi:hypothetical protein
LSDLSLISACSLLCTSPTPQIRRQEEQQAKKDEVAAVKAAKKFETFATRKQNGSFCEYESVLVMDAATSRAALGLALSAELDRRKTMCWQVGSVQHAGFRGGLFP